MRGAAGASARLDQTLSKFAAIGFSDFAVTGGVCLSAHLGERLDTLNDLDLVVGGMSKLPTALATTFLISHCHENVRAGRMLLQLVDAETALRIDIFSAYGASLSRCITRGALRMLSPEDLAARLASILLDLELGRCVARKYAANFERIVPLINRALIASAWRDQRKPSDPARFEEAEMRIRACLDQYADRLVEAVYDADPARVCPDCLGAGPFKPASSSAILAVLGYC